MDDILILAPSRWQLRRAVATMNGVLEDLGLEQHPDKTTIGPVARGFDFLGYTYSAAGLGLAEKTIQNHRVKLHRLYEQYLRARKGVPRAQIEAAITTYTARIYPVIFFKQLLWSANVGYFYLTLGKLIMNFIKKSGALVLLASLAACSGGTDSTEIIKGAIEDAIDASEDPINTISFEELVALDDRTEAAVTADSEDLVGTATMSGGMYLSTPQETNYTVGNMNMVADFTNSEISGAATELKDYDISGDCVEIIDCNIELAVSFDGELILDGVINGTLLTGTLNGELTASEDVTEGEETFTVTGVADVNLNVSGGFFVDDAGLMAGAEFEGDASLDTFIGGELEETVVDTLTGGFIVAE